VIIIKAGGETIILGTKGEDVIKSALIDYGSDLVDEITTTTAAKEEIAEICNLLTYLGSPNAAHTLSSVAGLLS